jgi:hypothetical protein
MQDKETNQRNKLHRRHGYWEVYSPHGDLWFKGYYINGVEFGYFEHWSYYNSSGIIEYYAR